jgi:uracil-DNA glycosylase
LLGWKELYKECTDCRKCGLGYNRTNMVFGEGHLKASIMFIGEAPGIIVCLGSTAMKYVISKEWRITRDRGKWIEKKGFHMMDTFHPAAFLEMRVKNFCFGRT